RADGESTDGSHPVESSRKFRKRFRDLRRVFHDGPDPGGRTPACGAQRSTAARHVARFVPVSPARTTPSRPPAPPAVPGPAAEAAEEPRPASPTPIGRIPVIEVSPVVEGGRWPAKAVTGEAVRVRATVFREGHDAVAATAVLVAPDGADHSSVTMTPVDPGLDHMEGWLVPDREGEWSFRVEGWSHPYGTWLHDAQVKVDAGVDVELMLTEGALLLERAAARPGLPADARTVLTDA